MDCCCAGHISDLAANGETALADEQLPPVLAPGVYLANLAKPACGFSFGSPRTQAGHRSPSW